MATIHLFSDALLSKWGFGDGDEPDAWMDYCDEHGIDWTRIEWHPILVRLVRTHLLPAIDQRVEVVEIETIHNPIRAETVDGVDVTDHWYDSSGSGPALTPECVEVPFGEVLKIAQELSTAAPPSLR
jgi:hypothetical protein